MKPRCFPNQYFFLAVIAILSISFFYFGTYRNWPYKIEADGKYYYQYLVSGVYDLDFDFTDNYRAEKYHWMIMEIDHYRLRHEITPATGKPVNYWTIGPAILWLPFFLAATLLGKLANSLNMIVDTNPFGLYMQYATMFSAVFYTVLALWLLYRLMIRYYPEATSKIALWLILFMTPLYYYTIFQPSLSHVYDFFTFTGLFYLLVQFRPEKKTSFYILAGVLCALHVLVRTQNLLTVFILLLLLFLQTIRAKAIGRATILKWLVLGVTLLVCLMPVPLINAYLFGGPFTIPQGEGFLQWSDPQIASLLFSWRNGLFSHHPIFLVGLVGFVYALYRQRYDNNPLFWGLLLVFLAQVYVNATVEDWWAGHSFGQRRLLFSLPLFAFGLAHLIEALQRNYERIYRWGLFPVVAAGTVLWFYLTMIHVFIWDYNQPHHIYRWMFLDAPDILLRYYGYIR